MSTCGIWRHSFTRKKRVGGIDMKVGDQPCTANEEPVRIHYKCLVPIYEFPEMKLCGLVISKTELKSSVSKFPHSCICERFIFFPRIGCLFCCNQKRQTDPGIHRSQTHECRNWERGRVVSFLEIHKSDFQYSVYKNITIILLRLFGLW
jgi:hypothetical protein